MFDETLLSLILLIYVIQIIRCDHHDLHRKFLSEDINEEDEKTIVGLKERLSSPSEDVQQDIRLIIMPLMIRMLLERLTEQARETRKLSQTIYTSTTDHFTNGKSKSFSRSIEKYLNLITSTIDVQQTTIIISLVLSSIVLLFMMYLILRQLRMAHHFNTIRMNTKETQRLLP